MRTNKTLLNAIIEVVISAVKPMIKKTISVDFVKVISVDAQKMIATVKSHEDEGEYKVPLALDSDLKTAWIKPKQDTNAYVSDNNGVKFFVHFEKIEKIVIGHGNTVQGAIKIKEQQDEINSKVKDKINEIINFLNDFKANYSAHVHTSPAGGGATSPSTTPFPANVPTSAQPIDKANYELKDIIEIKY